MISISSEEKRSVVVALLVSLAVSVAVNTFFAAVNGDDRGERGVPSVAQWQQHSPQEARRAGGQGDTVARQQELLQHELVLTGRLLELKEMALNSGGAASQEDVAAARQAFVLADLAVMRSDGGMRFRGVSVAELVVKKKFASKKWVDTKLLYQAGNVPLEQVIAAELALVELKRQLSQAGRITGNAAFQAAAAAWEKDGSKANLKALWEAERDAYQRRN